MNKYRAIRIGSDKRIIADQSRLKRDQSENIPEADDNGE